MSLWCSPSRRKPQNCGILMDRLLKIMSPIKTLIHTMYICIYIYILYIKTYMSVINEYVYVYKYNCKRYLSKGSHKLYQPRGSQFEGPVHCDWVSEDLHDIRSDLQAFHSVYLSNWNQIQSYTFNHKSHPCGNNMLQYMYIYIYIYHQKI